MLEIVRKLEDQTGFHVLRRRWVVERTFAWIGRFRRLSKDHEELLVNSEAMTQIAAIQTVLHRLCRPPTRQRR